MKYTSIDKALFEGNRKRFAAALPAGAMAIFNANDEMPRSADGNFPFRQNADLFYLSGIDQEETVLVVFPNCPNPAFSEALFLKQTDEHIAVWEGHKYTKEEARAASGIQNIYWISEFPKVLPMLMNWASSCYLNANEHDRYVHTVPYRDLRFSNEVRQRWPLMRYERSAPIMQQLRQIKSDAEIVLMQQAMDITEKAFRRVLKFVKPGVMEYEIEAEIQHEFLRNRATGQAYGSIIASGPNACVLHYVDNNMACKDGDLLLMDFGAEYANYAADLTRCIPVGGKFTKRQADVYNAVLSVMKFATSRLVVGNRIDDYHKEVGLAMEEQLIKLGLLDAAAVKKQDPERPLYKRYFMHGTSHFLGLDVHDVGNKFEPMKAGMVFTCEPGIYIPEEGLGIRLENDILITAKGNVDLMARIPLEIKDIEALMASK